MEAKLKLYPGEQKSQGDIEQSSQFSMHSTGSVGGSVGSVGPVYSQF
jgi:hypothetical protein